MILFITIILILLISYKVLFQVFFHQIIKYALVVEPIGFVKLKKEIRRLLEKSAIEVKTIYVTEMKKYRVIVAGIGKIATIYISNSCTLKHDYKEITALIAHELGHRRYKHNIKGLCLSVLNTGISILPAYLFNWYIEDNLAVFVLGAISYVILYFAILYFITMPLSRLQEYKADRYAAMVYDIEPLISIINKTPVRNKVFNTHPHIKKRLKRVLGIKYATQLNKQYKANGKQSLN